MRAREPDLEGTITRNGVRVAYDVCSEGNSPTVLLLPIWSIVHAGHRKFQVPVLARQHRVITMDGPDQIAAAIVEEISRPVDYLPVAAGGAARAAARIGALL